MLEIAAKLTVFNAIYHLWDQVFNYIDPRQFLKRIILIIRVDLKFFKRKEVSFNVLPQVEGELDFIFERAAEKLGRGITLFCKKNGPS